MKQMDRIEQEKYLQDVLREIGIREGHCILDCCCGAGTYTIAAAQLVGAKGSVYAVDRDFGKLGDLKRKVDAMGLQNVEIMRQNVELKIPLPNRCVDVALLYDIFWYFRPMDSKTRELIREVYRIAKPNGLVSVYPTHIGSADLAYFKEQMQKESFSLEGEHSRQLVHEKNLERGRLLNFRKRDKTSGSA